MSAYHDWFSLGWLIISVWGHSAKAVVTSRWWSCAQVNRCQVGLSLSTDGSCSVANFCGREEDVKEACQGLLNRCLSYCPLSYWTFALSECMCVRMHMRAHVHTHVWVQAYKYISSCGTFILISFFDSLSYLIELWCYFELEFLVICIVQAEIQEKWNNGLFRDAGCLSLCNIPLKFLLEVA